MSEQYGKHYSVMLKECIDYLPEFNDGDIFVDGTFGGGGHCLEIANRFTNITVFGVDQDLSAIANGRKKIEDSNLTSRVNLVHSNFNDFPDKFRADHPGKKIKGILVDLGVSSHQFDTAERGFSFRFDAELDMRMNQDIELTAKEIVNEFEEEEIADILFELGEERLSRKIARNILEFRANEPINTTKQLEDIIFHSYPKKMRFGKTHPATRSFQALRIYVNQELTVLKESIPKFWDLLDNGGRLLAISFHSLEDRIIKHKFREIFHIDKNAAKILTKRPLTASVEELEQNPRSRSAKLRVIEKI